MNRLILMHSIFVFISINLFSEQHEAPLMPFSSECKESNLKRFMETEI